MEKNKIGLFEVWLGKIPDYFKYHVETIVGVSCADFHFFTNDIEYDFSYINHKNFILHYIDEKKFLEKFNNISKIKIDNISNPKKITDFKIFYFDMFENISKDYEYIGVYDIDTLFGNINKLLVEYIGTFDFISVGGEKYHNRLSGPFLIMKNIPDIRKLMKTDKAYEALQMEEIYGYGEKELSEIAMTQFKTKIIHSMNLDVKNGGKMVYDVRWSGGQLDLNGEEIMLYHFYRKNKTSFTKVGNQIYAHYNKKLLSDFYWLCYFTENYSDLVPYLLESIKKFSNRKCIIYTINFDYTLPPKFLTSNQFIIKRFDIAQGKKDLKGRDFNILSSKGFVCSDVINAFPNEKFVYIDTDIYFTTNSDDIVKYFSELENYPLINSHIHDVIYASGILPNEVWTSSLHILLKEMSVVKEPVFPRRKTNIMVFDRNSLWFFEEQNAIFEKYKESSVPGILRLHDEDIANAILTKYNLTKSLPLIDIEETYHIDINKIFEYSYHMTNISPWVKLPKNQNEFLFFHRFKKIKDFEMIEKEYGNDVLDCEELVINYEKNKILFEKNSFLTTKNINENVDFIVKDLNGGEIISLNNQNIKNYWLFYISDIHLEDGVYCVEIKLSNSKFRIFNDLLEVKN